jgi:hypothetical protein
MRRILALLATAVFGLVGLQAVIAQDVPVTWRWYKGNLHAHTIQSDGDSTPYDAMAWYKRNGYQFLAITDHNAFTDPAPIDTNPNDGFLLVGSEEITNSRTVHVNAIGISQVIPASIAATVTEILAANLAAIRAQGAIPLINHPNYGWAFTAKEMLPLQAPFLLEIASGHPLVNHAGDGRSASSEQMWDQLLSAGIRVFAAAVDDVHNFRDEFTQERASPGRAWVMVRASSLTRESILLALSAGDFYASTGVLLTDVRSSPESLTIEIKPACSAEMRSLRFERVQGRRGRPVRQPLRSATGYCSSGRKVESWRPSMGRRQRTHSQGTRDMCAPESTTVAAFGPGPSQSSSILDGKLLGPPEPRDLLEWMLPNKAMEPPIGAR